MCFSILRSFRWQRENREFFCYSMVAFVCVPLFVCVLMPSEYGQENIFLKMLYFGSKECTKELKLECANSGPDLLVSTTKP